MLNGLEVAVPAEPTAEYFYSHVEARDGFAIKADSEFLLRFSLTCQKWPTPRNGVSAGLFLDVKKKGSRYQSMYQVSLVRESDNVSGKEVYGLSGRDLTVTPSRFFSKEVETDEEGCRFSVSHDGKSLVFRVVANPGRGGGEGAHLQDRHQGEEDREGHLGAVDLGPDRLLQAPACAGDVQHLLRVVQEGVRAALTETAPRRGRGCARRVTGSRRVRCGRGRRQGRGPARRTVAP